MAVVFDGKCLFLLIMLTRISHCQTQNCSSNLTNTVVYEGSPASFERARSSQSVKWEVYPSSDFYNSPSNTRLIRVFDVWITVVDDRYAISDTRLNILNSTITANTSLQHSYATAGLYVLTYRDPNCTYGANLIVIRSGPVCSSDSSDPNNVKLLCSVDFAESSAQPNYPVFTWKKGTSVVKQQQPTPSRNSSFLMRSTSEFVIDGNDVAKRYECQLTFSSTPSSPFNYVTSTAPDFTASCFSPIVFVNCDTTRLNIIIAATVGSFVAVIVIITVIAVVVKRGKKAKKQTSNRESKGNQPEEDGYTKTDRRTDRLSTHEYDMISYGREA